MVLNEATTQTGYLGQEFVTQVDDELPWMG
jgi:hypothetical protein